MKNSARSDSEILKDLVEKVMEYNSLRDDEWDFMDNHGDPCMWSEKEEKDHDALVDYILRCRTEVRNLIVEATGDEYISF